MPLSTYLPLPALVLLGDVPPAPAVALGHDMPAWLAYALPALGLFVYSLMVGALNEVIRKRDAEGVPVSPRLRLVAAILNAAAANLDKSRQQVAAAKAPAVLP